MYNFSLLFYIEVLILLTIIFFTIKAKIFYKHTKRLVKTIGEDEIREKIRQKKQVIDTRMKDDMTFDYIKGVRNVSTMDLMQGTISLKWDQPLYIVDWSEKKELKSANKFRKRGASEIYILENGMSGVHGKTSGRFEKIDNIKLTDEDIESMQ